MFLLLFSETDGRKMISFLLKCSVDLPVNPSMHGIVILCRNPNCFSFLRDVVPNCAIILTFSNVKMPQPQSQCDIARVCPDKQCAVHTQHRCRRHLSVLRARLWSTYSFPLCWGERKQWEPRLGPPLERLTVSRGSQKVSRWVACSLHSLRNRCGKVLGEHEVGTFVGKMMSLY